MKSSHSSTELIISTNAEAHWLESFARDGKYRILLKAKDVAVPVLLVNGKMEGPRLVVTASIHGDEFEGIRALHEVFEQLVPNTMSGSLLAVPVAHVAAFQVANRRSPIDDADLARTFPGNPEGSATERVAALLAEHVIAHADFFLDLHSGGIRYEMPSMIGCNALDPRSMAAATAFGASVIWEHDAIAAGRTLSFAASKGIPWLYTEASGGGRVSDDDLAMMKNGVLNLLRHLGIIRETEEPKPREEPIRLRGPGNTDGGVEAGASGLLRTSVRLLQTVRAGEVLGDLVDEYGRVLETYMAPDDGVVGLIHQFAKVNAGETLFLLAERA